MSEPSLRSDRPQRVQTHLFERAVALLTIGEVEALFCDRLGIHRSTFFESHRPFLPFVYTRVRPVKGKPGEFKRGSPRLRVDVAEACVELAAAGLWAEYAAGELLDERPELYPRSMRAAA